MRSIDEVAVTENTEEVADIKITSKAIAVSTNFAIIGSEDTSKCIMPEGRGFSFLTY